MEESEKSRDADPVDVETLAQEHRVCMLGSQRSQHTMEVSQRIEPIKVNLTNTI